MRIDLLCSGSKGNSCLIRTDRTQIVIDCGSTKKYLMQAFKRVKACVEDTSAVFITHGHIDHISQRKMFAKFPIYSYCDMEDVECPIHVEPFETIRIEDLSIQVIPLSHDAPKTVGYVVNDGKEKLVYITDTGYLANSNKPYLTNANYYIFESNHDVPMLMATSRPTFLKQRILSPYGHLNNEECAKNLAELIGENTTQIVLAHLSQEANTAQLALKTFSEVLQRKKIDLDRICVRAADQFEIETIA